MGSKAFLFMGVLIFSALLLTSEQVIARDLAETSTYPKNEDGTIKPNGVGEAEHAYGRPFGGGSDSGRYGPPGYAPGGRYGGGRYGPPGGRYGPPSYNRGGYP